MSLSEMLNTWTDLLPGGKGRPPVS
jgi:hypothetical protein